jgi:uncharacterized protein (DUF305 family)
MKGNSTGRAGLCVLVIAMLSGCGGSAASRPGDVATPGASGPAAAPALRAHPADAQFMQGMIHHHAQAIIMAGWSKTHGANPAVQTLSQRITVSQTDEIKMMQLWLGERGQDVPEATATGMKMNMGGMEHTMLMPGMLTAEQMAKLEAARGTEFDRLFLTYMIQHHEGALTMVNNLLATHGGGVDDFVYKIASDTFADQGSEIDRMHRMLDAMGAGGGDV